MERFVSKEVRGLILIALKYGYPAMVGDKILSDVILDAQYAISPQVVSAHLNYLEEKGYIELVKIDSKELCLVRVLAKLTPKGIDLLEGNIPSDPGVELS